MYICALKYWQKLNGKETVFFIPLPFNPELDKSLQVGEAKMKFIYELEKEKFGENDPLNGLPYDASVVIPVKHIDLPKLPGSAPT